MQVLEPIRARRASSTVRPVTQAARNVLLQRAQFLSEQDRLLLDLVFKRDLSLREVGIILGNPPGTICRRVHRLCKRLRDPLVAALLGEKCDLPTDAHNLAIAYFAQAQTIDQIADAEHLSREQVRHILTYVRGWFLAAEHL